MIDANGRPHGALAIVVLGPARRLTSVEVPQAQVVQAVRQFNSLTLLRVTAVAAVEPPAVRHVHEGEGGTVLLDLRPDGTVRLVQGGVARDFADLGGGGRGGPGAPPPRAPPPPPHRRGGRGGGR